MRKITYYRGALALPLVPPLVCWALFKVGLFQDFASFLMGATLLGAIPYALAAIALIVASMKMQEEKFEYWWHVAPFIAALMFMVTLCAILLYHYVREHDAVGGPQGFDFTALGAGSLVGGVYCLVVGYVYVMIAKLFYWLLRAVNVIRSPPRDGPFT